MIYIPRGSRAGWLASFEVGERRYIETSFDDYPNRMRNLNMPHSRRPEILRDRVFTTTLLTAVSAGAADDVRYLICVERVS